MKRFFGMMPSNEIEREKVFKDCYGKKVIITAGRNGWTVIYYDGTTKYKDEVNDVDVNFNNAYKIANDSVGPLTSYDCAITINEVE